MTAPASITVTPVHVADLHVEGEVMPINVHVIDHPEGRILVDTGMTELHPLLDAISAAVIGGTSLFGGRGEVRSAILGSAVIATIANALFIRQYSNGVIFMTTGCILLFAVTLDTIARRRQAKTGR